MLLQFAASRRLSHPIEQEMRKAKYIRNASSDRDVLHTTAELHLPVESTAATAGITLLPASTVEQLLVDKRRLELVQPFKLALLKLSSQVRDEPHACMRACIRRGGGGRGGKVHSDASLASTVPMDHRRRLRG
jgi:hypothetical protein